MFYALLFLWLIACIACSILTHLRQKLLSTTCPCVAVGGLAAATILYISGYSTIALIFLVSTVYLWAILRWSLYKQQKSVTVKA